MQIAALWKEYELLDSGEGLKLERWGAHLLARPDPQALWPKANSSLWKKAEASYTRDSGGGGRWDIRGSLPKRWEIAYSDLKFHVRPTDFKHLGLFPEQAVNWDWMRMKVKGAGRPIAALNLFGYTGAASLALAKEGAQVSHVDAAKGMVEWCKDNAALNKIHNIRTIVDDVVKFTDRELKRGRRYDAILLDPPSFGRGISGETWKIEKHLWPLLQKLAQLLSDKPLFVVLNSYTAGYSPQVMQNLLSAALKNRPGSLESGELGLSQESDGKILPCGIYARWEANSPLEASKQPAAQGGTNQKFQPGRRLRSKPTNRG